MMSGFHRLGIAIGIAALLAGAPLAGAHQPYESNAVVRLDPDGLEITLTASPEIAGQLIGEPMRGTAAFEKFRPQFLKAGGTLYEVTTHGRRLEPQRIFFSEREGEAVFSIIYPLVENAGLLFRATYLDKLPPGYAGAIEVLDETGKILGQEPRLKKGQTKNMFALLPTAPVPDSRPPAKSAANPVAAPTAAGKSQPLFALISIASLVLSGIWLLQRFHPRKNPSSCIPPVARSRSSF